ENGMAVAESISKFGTAPEFMYGKVTTPEWLTLGGDLRGASGYMQAPQRYLVTFPMQTDLYAVAQKGNIDVAITIGYRPPEEGNEALTSVWSREHYVRWEQDGSTHQGVSVRVGRFMPVFGLRFAEHPIYTRRYGGTALYSDTYAAEVGFVSDKLEAHATGFIKDPLIDPVRHANGAAAYAELHVAEHTIVGAGGMAEIGGTHDGLDYGSRFRGEISAKQYLAGPDVLVQAELQIANPHVDGYGYKQIIGYVMGTWFGRHGVMVDLGVGHYDENIGLHGLDRDCVDLNVHWFATSHVELNVTNRVELIGKGGGGPTGAYSLLMAHYRL
ncbi:MAG TPA: hypothetical protein VMZ53_27070, partial [Kofleriaceae bacterium]|nr:hypothetical protein [Kofleriaceae bacterium]